ncbi:MAG: hypothetical protein HOO92_10955 [Methylococcaceae bacterium]|nr:hypothetical protein [Methylococcaceae bacterium]
MNKYKMIAVAVSVMIFCSSCYTRVKENPLKSLTVNECVENRRNSSVFNSKKSTTLLDFECQQILMLDTRYRRFDELNFRVGNRQTAVEDQEYFDDEAWLLITEWIRKEYYEDLLSPEEEVNRAKFLNDSQNKNGDQSVLREYEPRLLPVSPYLMNYSYLEKADLGIEDMWRKYRDDKTMHRKLSVIMEIVSKEKQRKDIFNNGGREYQ